MTEVLSYVLQRSDKDPEMYTFLEHEIIWIDDSDELTNYPIWFLLKLADEIGIGINVENPNGLTFDLQDGVISNQTPRSEEHTSELQSRPHLVCRLLLEKKKKKKKT